jgi:hypothetical protein
MRPISKNPSIDIKFGIAHCTLYARCPEIG